MFALVSSRGQLQCLTTLQTKDDLIVVTALIYSTALVITFKHEGNPYFHQHKGKGTESNNCTLNSMFCNDAVFDVVSFLCFSIGCVLLDAGPLILNYL